MLYSNDRSLEVKHLGEVHGKTVGEQVQAAKNYAEDLLETSRLVPVITDGNKVIRAESASVITR